MELSPCQLQGVSIVLLASFVFATGNTYTNNGKPAIRLDDLLHMSHPDLARTVSKPKPLVYAYSNELIRLRGNDRFLNSGLVEVYRAGQWGYVCDDRWDLKDASVACKQLGFTMGAFSASDTNSSLSELQRSSANILMDDVQCFGTESSLHECPYNALNDCTLDEVAGVICHANEGCPEDWISGFGKCYTFYDEVKTIQLAANVCARFNASLVTIDSVQENHFLSNIIKNSVAYIHQWYTGGKKTKNKWQWNKLIFVSVENTKKSKKRSKSKNRRATFKTVKSTVAFDRWFPGWPSFNNKYAEPADAKGLDCLTLSDEYNDPTTETPVVGDYFYWKADKCRNDAGISFICQRNVDRKKVSNQGCYNDNGASYRGNVEITESGSHCLKWLSSSIVNDRTHPGKGLGDHNFCRNPDDDTKPWCWVSHVHRRFGFCNISKCSEVEVTTAATAGLSGCYNDNGASYRGNVEITESGSHCLKWLSSSIVNDRTHPGKGLGDHNFCRNPDDDTKPWCWVSHVHREIGFCKISKCSEVEVTTAAPAGLSALSPLNCPAREFYCSSQKICIPGDFHCDNERDCMGGEDEVNCDYTLNNFNKTADSALRVYFNRGLSESQSYREISDEMCAKKCVENKKFVCKSFTYDRLRRTCELSNMNSWFALIVPSVVYDYYELKQEEVKVRLVGGEEHSGTVEITYEEAAGVICDDDWSIEDATVVCRMLGYRGAMQATEQNFYKYPHNDVNIVLDNVNCKGDETSLKDCEKETVSHDCDAYEIAGVVCRVSKVCEMEQFKCKNDLCVSAQELCNSNDDCGDNSDEKYCQSVSFQLVNGSTPSEGRVEVTRNGFRGTVCDDGWDDQDAAVVCRKLGFKYGGEALSNGFFGSGTGPIWLDDVNCSGTEVSLEHCPHQGWAKHNCNHGEDAGVKCFDRPTRQTPPTTMRTTRTTAITTQMTRSTSRTPSTAVSFQLVNGSTPSEGRVEVTRNGFRGTVCDDNWDDQDAAVVCRKLGFMYGGEALSNGFFGSGTGPIWLDDVHCSGTEVSLEHCPHQGWAKHNCNHGEDAGVKCFDRPTRQTPPTTMRTTRTTAITTQMTRSTSRTPSTAVSFQLVNGSTPSEGRVEVTRNGFRGTVCDDNWDDQDAAVVCRKLGFKYGGEALSNGFFGSGTGPIWLDDVHCSGTEVSLEHCPHQGWAKHNCNHGEDAGVKCFDRPTRQTPPTTMRTTRTTAITTQMTRSTSRTPSTAVSFQLVNGSTPSEGRVEVTRNGFRGTVCDDNWDDQDAAVVCRKLGFKYGGEALSNGFFGSGTGPIWLDDVHCSGTEVSLEHCPHQGWAKHNCNHGEDAGVKCFDRPTRQTPPTTMRTTRTTAITTQMTRSTSRTPSTAILQIKLVGGRDASEGNVEVVINNVKFRVCDDYWDNKEAVVICKMLGYSAGGVATHQSFFGSDPFDIIFDNVDCNGTETDFGQCLAIMGVKKHDCTQSEIAGVICVKDSTPTKEPGSTLTNETIITGTCGRRPYDHVDFGKLRNKRDNPFTTTLPDIPKHLEKFHQTKIAGGNYAQHGAYPWQVSVHQVFNKNAAGAAVYGVHHCGATIISEFWLLSAAHCFLGKRKTEFEIIVGDHSQKLIDVGEQTFSVEDLIVHDLHNVSSKDNDIALIKIKPAKGGHGIKFDDYVQPACLPDSRTPFVEGTKCWISGWGNVNPSGSSNTYPDILKAVEVPLVSQRQCERLYTKNISTYLSQRMFCAGYIKGGVDSCDGDSGGPLVCKIADVYTVVGITSWGRGCATPNLPGVYTRVSAFAQWIDGKIKLHSKNNAERKVPSTS